MKSDSELLLVGLKSHRKDIQAKITRCLKEWAEQSDTKDLSVDDLNELTSDVSKYRSELAEVQGRILKLEPPCNFAADDIPF